MRYVSATSIVEFDSDDWDILVPDIGFYSSHAWLLSQEAADWTNETYHLMRAEDGRPLAAAVTQSFTQGRYDFPEHVKEPDRAILLGGRTGYHNELLHEPSAEGEAAWTHLQTEILRHFGRDGVSAVVLDFVPGPVVRWLAERFHVEVALRDVSAEITGAFDLTSYLSRFDQKRRTQFRSEIRKFEEAYDVRVRRLDLCVDEVAPLVARTLEKYGISSDAGDVRLFLEPQADALGSSARVLSCHANDGKALGAVIGFDWRDTFFLRVAGFDYPNLKNAFEYFNLVYYQPFKDPTRKLERLHLGPGSIETKLRRGAQPYAVWAVTLSPELRQHEKVGATYVETDEACHLRREMASLGILVDRMFQEAGLEAPHP